MTIQVPEPVQWLVPIVVGADWPEGDEDALHRLAQAWEQAAKVIDEATGGGNTAAQAALGTMQGEAAKAFAKYWDHFVAGDGQFLGTLQQACEELGRSCEETALDIEYTKLSIIAALLVLAAQIAAMVAAAFTTLGASTAGIPAAQAATRITVQLAFRELIKQIAVNAATNVGLDMAIQGLQIASGNRSISEWDLGKTVDAGISGAAAGIAGGSVGLASDTIGRHSASLGATALRGATEGAIADAGASALNDLAHGNVPSLQGVALGATSGSIGGTVDATATHHAALPKDPPTSTEADRNS